MALDETTPIHLVAAPIVVAFDVSARASLREYVPLRAAPIGVEFSVTARGVNRIGDLALHASRIGILFFPIARGIKLTELPPLQSRFQRWYAAEAAGWAAVDERNRLLAKEASDGAAAAAAAIVQTNTRVTDLEDGVQAEASRITALTTRVATAEGVQETQGSAISALQITSTQHGNTLSSHGQQLTSINVQVTGLDGEVTNIANATTLLQAEVDSLGATKATWGVYLTAGNLIAGLQSINDGVLAEFNILAHVFRLLSPGATNGMEVQDGYLRVWRGGTQVLIGNGFGASGDLMLYAGPNVGVAAASKSNGIFWFDSGGNAYFGGSLSAGVLKNAAQSTQISPAAQVETGPFGTNGNQKVVTYSLNYFNTGRWDTNLGTGSITATVVLERSYAGGAFTQVGTINITGQRVSEYDAEFGNYAVTLELGGSSTFTDNLAGGGTFNYRVRVTAASGWPFILNGGTFGTQRLSVISVES